MAAMIHSLKIDGLVKSPNCHPKLVNCHPELVEGDITSWFDRACPEPFYDFVNYRN